MSDFPEAQEWLDKRDAARKKLKDEFKDNETKSELPDIDTSELYSQLSYWRISLSNYPDSVYERKYVEAQQYLDEILTREAELRQMYHNSKQNRYSNSKDVIKYIERYMRVHGESI